MLDYYIQNGAERLRCGYTTGSCAALAAAGAADALLGGAFPASETLRTPKGIDVTVPLEDCRLEPGRAVCAVRKDGGDDIDATDGLHIEAAVTLTAAGVDIDGGAGVGRVTQKGLQQPVGAAAINETPRRMIREALAAVAARHGYTGGFAVVISVPEGEAAARKTFNPNLGIVGGISILGTSGIVEPKSLRALLDSIVVELRMRRANGAADILVTPGNYGADFIAKYPRLARLPVVQCANFVGETLDACAALGFRRVLLVGHVGKFCKLAGGVMDTHSRVADCRAEIFAAYAAACGADRGTVERLLASVTSDGCLDILEPLGLLQPVMARIIDKAQQHIDGRVRGAFETGVVFYSSQRGVLGLSDSAQKLIPILEEENL